MSLYANRKLLHKITKESVGWIFKSDVIDFLNITIKKKIYLHASSRNFLCAYFLHFFLANLQTKPILNGSVNFVPFNHKDEANNVITIIRVWNNSFRQRGTCCNIFKYYNSSQVWYWHRDNSTCIMFDCKIPL